MRHRRVASERVFKWFARFCRPLPLVLNTEIPLCLLIRLASETQVGLPAKTPRCLTKTAWSWAKNDRTNGMAAGRKSEPTHRPPHHMRCEGPIFVDGRTCRHAAVKVPACPNVNPDTGKGKRDLNLGRAAEQPVDPELDDARCDVMSKPRALGTNFFSLSRRSPAAATTTIHGHAVCAQDQ